LLGRSLAEIGGAWWPPQRLGWPVQLPPTMHTTGRTSVAGASQTGTASTTKSCGFPRLLSRRSLPHRWYGERQGDVQDGPEACGSCQQTADEREADAHLQQHFRSIQQISDSTTLPSLLPQLRDHLYRNTDIPRLMDRLRCAWPLGRRAGAARRRLPAGPHRSCVCLLRILRVRVRGSGRSEVPSARCLQAEPNS
jgi:hypothetical protein